MHTVRPPVCLAILLCAAATAVTAQEYPAKPVRIIVTFPPGGGTDIVARMLAQKLTETMGQQVVVDNRGGAGGTIGTDLIAKAAPDGYTAGVVSGSHAINPSLYRKLPYDTLRDFTPVTMLVAGPGILVVHPSVPARSVRDLVTLARAQPGQIAYASPGSGTPPHLGAELFSMLAGIRLVHVPYKGNAQAMTDLMGGQVSMSFPVIPAALQHVNAGRLRALAVTSAARTAILPDLPTVAESGLSGYESISWYALLLPAGAPAGVVARLYQETAKVLRLPDIREKLAVQGLDPVGNRPEVFALALRSEIDKWAKVVKVSGARAE
jgi:tripartite-type tricarboxylate transporter receptor subunit TctC